MLADCPRKQGDNGVGHELHEISYCRTLRFGPVCHTSEVKYFQALLASRITQLALVDALFVSIAQRRKNKTTKHLQQAGEKLLEHRLEKP